MTSETNHNSYLVWQTQWNTDGMTQTKSQLLLLTPPLIGPPLLAYLLWSNNLILKLILLQIWLPWKITGAHVSLWYMKVYLSLGKKWSKVKFLQYWVRLAVTLITKIIFTEVRVCYLKKPPIKRRWLNITMKKLIANIKLEYAN